MSEYGKMKEDAQRGVTRVRILDTARRTLAFDNVLNEKGTAVALKFPNQTAPVDDEAALANAAKSAE